MKSKAKSTVIRAKHPCSSCSESGETLESGEAREKGNTKATTFVKKSSKKQKVSRNILSEEEVKELCERLESKRHEFNILSIYSALKEAILCDKDVLSEISEDFVDESIEVIHNVYHKKR